MQVYVYHSRSKKDPVVLRLLVREPHIVYIYAVDGALTGILCRSRCSGKELALHVLSLETYDLQGTRHITPGIDHTCHLLLRDLKLCQPVSIAKHTEVKISSFLHLRS